MRTDRRTTSGRNLRSTESEVGEERLRVEEYFQWAGRKPPQTTSEGGLCGNSYRDGRHERGGLSHLPTYPKKERRASFNYDSTYLPR